MADLLRHGDTVSIDESEDLVIVKYRVHGLNPESVHWPVKHHPLLIELLICRATVINTREICYIVKTL